MINQFWTVILCLVVSFMLLVGIGGNIYILLDSIKSDDKKNIVLFTIILTTVWLIISFAIYTTTLTPTITWL